MVKLVTVPKVHFVMDYAGGNGMKVTPEVTILDAAKKQADADVTVELWMTGGSTGRDGRRGGRDTDGFRGKRLCKSRVCA